MCISLAGCGAPSADNNSTAENVINTETQKTENNNSADETDSLPMALGEAYTCTLDGYSGYVMVEEYEVVPDEMNEDCELRTAYISTLFNNVPDNFETGINLFPVSGKAEAVDETAFIVQAEYGEDYIFIYNNEMLYSLNDNGTYSSLMLVSYMCPENCDEVALAITAGGFTNSLADTTKADAVSSDSRWFIMGGLDNGTVTCYGKPVETAASDAAPEDLYLTGTGPADGSDGGQYVDSEYIDDGYSDDEYVDDSSSSSVSVDRTLDLIEEYSTMEAGYGNYFIAFNSVEMIASDATTNTLRVDVFYSGFAEGDSLIIYCYDAFSKDEWQEQTAYINGEGSASFDFVVDASSAPYYFDVSGRQNGEYLTDFYISTGVNVQ